MSKQIQLLAGAEPRLKLIRRNIEEQTTTKYPSITLWIHEFLGASLNNKFIFILTHI